MKKIIALIMVAAITVMTATTAFAQTPAKELAAAAVEVKGLEKDFPQMTPVFEKVVTAINQCIVAITTPASTQTSTPGATQQSSQTIVEAKTYEAAAYTQQAANIVQASVQPASTQTPAPVNPDVNKYLAQAAAWTAEAYALLK